MPTPTPTPTATPTPTPTLSPTPTPTSTPSAIPGSTPTPNFTWDSTFLSTTANVPLLVYPEGDSVVSNSAPLFQWRGIERNRGYRIQIATDPDFTNIVIDQEMSSSLARARIGELTLGSATYAGTAIASDHMHCAV
jgi:hypothetical protein